MNCKKRGIKKKKKKERYERDERKDKIFFLSLIFLYDMYKPSIIHFQKGLVHAMHSNGPLHQVLPHHMIIFEILCCSNHPCLLPCLPLKALHCWTHYHHSVHLENPLVYQYQLCHFIITHQHCSQVWAQLIQLLVAFY